MSGKSRLSSFLASLATQVRAAIHVGVPADDASGKRQSNAFESTLGLADAQQWDDAPGRMTRNGLGSLEVGAGKTRVEE
ncbi:MAG: hypothetical protein K2Y42_20855 [Hyphomicrobium sp.]|jgi:hypothetical protein|uniref:hypothetical protein n=1 Tax=Hyphomicrobium sp. TaxID=82 RepID=UPI0025C459DF|nr:hypothetical protein [Hyphomicrobium sp.]MBX9865200.1 hypothetical protein [Hyphomicrobium sp.]